VDATVREGFPLALTTFPQAMEQGPGDWLKAEGGWSGPYTRDAMRAARFVAGTACLTGAWSSFTPDRDLTVSPSYMGWWYDFYSAHRPTIGAPRPDSTGASAGWLGDGGDARELSSGLRERLFTNGRVLVNPTERTITDTSYVQWWRIQGTQDPTVDDGQQSRFTTVGPRDARFLWRIKRLARWR
jgi:hypothetical protein